jgi:hypothetical protein
MEQFEVCVEEDEVQIGLFRVPVPNYDRHAFREPSVNSSSTEITQIWEPFTSAEKITELVSATRMFCRRGHLK